jgi:hypothetical protein
MTTSDASSTGIAARLHVFQVLDITHFSNKHALPAAESTVAKYVVIFPPPVLAVASKASPKSSNPSFL